MVRLLSGTHVHGPDGKELKQWRGKVADFLNYLGEQGWELVSVLHTNGVYYYFKRLKP